MDVATNCSAHAQGVKYLKEIMREPHELLEEVKDEKSFLDFAKALMEDRESREGKTIDEVGFSGDWANNSISGFLDGAIAWAEDSDFGVLQEPELKDNKWKQFAVFLYCGKTYE
jgi:ethanolamine utilization protein EutA (predicted chaperonin)